ncbi:DNA-binding transcriptional MerR regulator [Deinococcus metalli]|uniref:DNA-binding transcriptional MerR regulator n=1 Tax=Deinococcus metalli TaxID=1141878 RepID=A0A7W8KL19_9DEIO|nr:MerR family DNA-binding protein [Deinococcus metalli]MBB5379223.1 DNA-binding transcriptional MerR regulator [Deinococcus metalli]GHF65538.1 MerR family transcriptional regulator [Deinococcus metalli]
MTTGERPHAQDRQDRSASGTHLLSIGQLARQTGESIKAIRYWTDRGLLTCTRRPSGYRTYPVMSGSQVRFIRSAQAAGFSLDAVQQVLAIRQAGEQPCEHVKAELEAHLSAVRAQIAHLQALEVQVQARLAWAHQHPDPPCNGAGCVYLDVPQGA